MHSPRLKPSAGVTLHLMVLGVTLSIGCGVSGSTSTDPFEGHTVERFESIEDLLAYGDLGVVPVQLKFVLPRFDQETPGRTHLLDPSFYHLHDEWYWFHLLNGQEIEGVDDEPVTGLSFDSIESIYAQYTGVAKTEIPLDLKWISDGERIYSPRFYELGLWDDPRKLGLGSLLYYRAHPDRVIPEDLWLFELEYSDGSSSAALSPELVRRFFTVIEAAIPQDLRPKLKWLLRSQEQRAIAEDMLANGDPLGGRVVTYADLVVAGEVQIYNPGIAAGYVRRFKTGTLAAANLRSNHVVLLEEVPDYLPPVAAILTAVPQTPLAHLNLLAASRGTPNAHVAGLMDIEGPEDWQTWKTPTLVRANEHGVVLQPLAKTDYTAYLDLLGVGSYTIPVADLSDAPNFFDLREGSLDDVSGLVPLAGGKAAGMMALVSDPDIPTPHAPMAVSVKPFVEHMEPLDAWIQSALSDPDFEDDGRIRFLVLEGEEDFLEENANDPDSQRWSSDWLTSDASEPLRGLIEVGGLKRVIRDQALDAAFEGELETFIEAQYAALDPSQGLRFRSSSTAEDAPGFNGAGLYDSNTGYRDPSLQEPALSKRTLAWAILKTWASYWGYEAFEERRLAGIDHLQGRMAVLVHPRFDDPLELSNGVIAFQLAREIQGDRRTMVVNTQQGALSVTNPDPDHPALPAIDQVSATGDAAPQIVRVQGSSEVSPGVQILEDAALGWLFERIDGLAQDWLDHQNADLSAEQARSSVQLDLEFKEMSSGWPSRIDGELTEAGLVLKQVRTLDRAARGSEEIAQLPVPRDVLEQAHVIRERACLGSDLEMRIIEVTTDPSVTWCLPYSEVPFEAQFELVFPEGLEEISLEAGHRVSLSHLEVEVTHTSLPGGDWDLVMVLSESARLAHGFDRLEVTTEGDWTLEFSDILHSGLLSCHLNELLLSPEAFLETLVSEDEPEP
jgi:hypothetical protein